MTNTQKKAIAKYVAAYPHLATLAERAESCPAAAKSLGGSGRAAEGA
ncbi:hypothetical protein [Kordiimonas sp.]